jgi:hypothetical protein
MRGVLDSAEHKRIVDGLGATAPTPTPTPMPAPPPAQPAPIFLHPPRPPWLAPPDRPATIPGCREPSTPGRRALSRQTLRSGRPVPVPPQANTTPAPSPSRRVSLGTGSERRSAVEAIGRFIEQSPGCRQGTILAPVAAWLRLPGSGAVSTLGHFGTKTRPQGRARHVTSDASDSDASGIDSG